MLILVQITINDEDYREVFYLTKFSRTKDLNHRRRSVQIVSNFILKLILEIFNKMTNISKQVFRNFPQSSSHCLQRIYVQCQIMCTVLCMYLMWQKAQRIQLQWWFFWVERRGRYLSLTFFVLPQIFKCFFLFPLLRNEPKIPHAPLNYTRLSSLGKEKNVGAEVYNSKQ